MVYCHTCHLQMPTRCKPISKNIFWSRRKSHKKQLRSHMLSLALLSSTFLVHYGSRQNKYQKEEELKQRLARLDEASKNLGVTFTSFITDLEKWMQSVGTHVEFKYFTGVDVGATNSRVSLLFSANNKSTILEFPKFECKSMKKLVDILTVLAREVVNVVGKPASGSALALAGPIEKDNSRVVITNYDQGVRELLKTSLPPGLFPIGKTRFLNDLEACSYGLIADGIEGNLGSHFVPAFEKKPANAQVINLQEQSYGVLAMGTGLGCGLIIGTRNTDGQIVFRPLSLEGGHVLLALEGVQSESYEKEKQRFEYISELLYNGKFPIEYEDICSGRGLQYCYDFELKYANKPPQQLTSADIAGRYTEDECARNALLAHYSYLMKAAQNIAVMIPSCKGVFFAGDNQVNNETFVNENAEVLKELFLNHPKREWIEPVTVYRQVEKRNFNLSGTFYAAQHLF